MIFTNGQNTFYPYVHIIVSIIVFYSAFVTPAYSLEKINDTVLLSASSPDITVNFLGDIILGRTVAMRIASRGAIYPFLRTASLTSAADLTVANLESPLSDKYPPIYRDTMDFVAPVGSVNGLIYAGIDLVALANNHSTNYGALAFMDTLKTLSDNNISYVGGGKSIDEARSMTLIDVNGVRFGFLNYNSIPGSLNAGSGNPGISFVHLKPWSGKNSQADIDMMCSDISSMRSQCDVLVVIMHWGVEYKGVIPTQTNLAHSFIDNGADIVIGTHPHVVQPVVVYNNKIIAYSLGNFIFDQMQSDETREGYMLQVYLLGKNLTGFKVFPYKIYDYAQPRWEGNAGLLQKVMPKIQ